MMNWISGFHFLFFNVICTYYESLLTRIKQQIDHYKSNVSISLSGNIKIVNKKLCVFDCISILIIVNMQKRVVIVHNFFQYSSPVIVIKSFARLTMENQTAMKNELLGWSFLLACARENYPRKAFPLRAPLCGKQRWFEEYL